MLTEILSSEASLKSANEARAAVLSFFKAPPEYTVVFTSNASGALKLVGESYPFTADSSYVLGVDSHNSVSSHVLEPVINTLNKTKGAWDP